MFFKFSAYCGLFVILWRGIKPAGPVSKQRHKHTQRTNDFFDPEASTTMLSSIAQCQPPAVQRGTFHESSDETIKTESSVEAMMPTQQQSPQLEHLTWSTLCELLLESMTEGLRLSSGALVVAHSIYKLYPADRLIWKQQNDESYRTRVISQLDTRTHHSFTPNRRSLVLISQSAEHERMALDRLIDILIHNNDDEQQQEPLHLLLESRSHIHGRRDVAVTPAQLCRLVQAPRLQTLVLVGIQWKPAQAQAIGLFGAFRTLRLEYSTLPEVAQLAAQFGKSKNRHLQEVQVQAIAGESGIPSAGDLEQLGQHFAEMPNLQKLTYESTHSLRLPEPLAISFGSRAFVNPNLQDLSIVDDTMSRCLLETCLPKLPRLRRLRVQQLEPTPQLDAALQAARQLTLLEVDISSDDDFTRVESMCRAVSQIPNLRTLSIYLEGIQHHPNATRDPRIYQALVQLARQSSELKRLDLDGDRIPADVKTQIQQQLELNRVGQRLRESMGDNNADNRNRHAPDGLLAHFLAGLQQQSKVNTCETLRYSIFQRECMFNKLLQQHGGETPVGEPPRKRRRTQETNQK